VDPAGINDQFVIMSGPPQFAIRYATIGIWIVLAVVVLVLWYLLQRTKLGLGYRAVSANPESAVLVAIPKERMLMFGWGLAAGLGTVAAVLFAQASGTLDFNLMAIVLLYGLAAAALGASTASRAPLSVGQSSACRNRSSRRCSASSARS
jgi:branched-chain amino acid transport system permease protein